jgi:Predicted AAA-ATPase
LRPAALLGGGVLSVWEEKDYRAVLDGTANRVLYERALGDLSAYLHRATGEQVVLLIDEYDEPIHAGHVGGHVREVLDVFRALLTGGLKDNPHLFRGVLTGILRIARESIFSGLNNLAVYSLLRPEFSTCFGFTEPEVEQLLARAGRGDQLGEVRGWYNGYDFGGTVVYNPWSVPNFPRGSRRSRRTTTPRSCARPERLRSTASRWRSTARPCR